MTRARTEGGQAAVVSVLFMTIVLGMAALVLDVGAWFREHRRLQAAADAAALAGAQLLPDDPAQAVAVAHEYARKNDATLAPADVAVATRVMPNDTIAVESRSQAPGLFSKLFGITVVDVAAAASARAANVVAARWVAPIAVNEQHPLLQCQPEPCFERTTTVELANLKSPESANASGSFGLLTLNNDPGSVSTTTLASWLRDGYPEPLEPGPYFAAPGARYNSVEFKSALNERLGDEVLLPVYRSVTGTGANAVFDVVAWVGFVPDGYTGSGSTGTLTGRFRRVTWEGGEGGSSLAPDFGVRTVLLIR